MTEITEQSKAAILIRRRGELMAKLDEATKYIDGLKNTRCGLKCAGCNTVLETEWDFAAHFVVQDERFLNLGDCPVSRNKPYRTASEDTVLTELNTDPWGAPRWTE